MIKKYYNQLFFFLIVSFLPSYGQITATDDVAFTFGPMCNILDNDTLNGLSITGTDVVISYTSLNSLISIDANGLVWFFGLPSGVYPVNYQICDAANPSNCASATVYVHGQGLLYAADDFFNGIDGTLGGTTTSVYDNDTMDGLPFMAFQVGVTLLSNNQNFNIDSYGIITVSPGTAAGTYTFGYRLCEGPFFQNCIDAFVTIQVNNAPCWKSVSIGDYQTSAIKNDGTLWSWGGNGFGNLGIGNTIDAAYPVQVGTDTDWESIAVGDYHTIAIKTNGTLWAWGWNQYGQLGDGTTVNKSTPVQIGTDTDWKFASALYGTSQAIKINNTLWGWGQNTNGEVGNGSNVNQSTPVQITSNTDWKTVSGGDAHVMAIKNAGTLWAWGFNDKGQLGNASIVSVNSPIPTGTSASFNQWKAVSASRSYTLGLLNDGTMWAWGDNAFGQLGDGTTTNSNIPIQVGSATDWAFISAGYFYRLAIKNDGTLWAWGLNSFGALGDGTTINRNTPVQIGTDTDWVKIYARSGTSAAMKSDGSLWIWGNNTNGQLGDGTHIASLSPMLVNCATLNVHENNSETTAAVFPNPTSGRFTVESDTEIQQVEIYDTNGRRMHRSIPHTSNVAITIEQFAPGVYVLKITTAKGASFQKIIKE